MIKLFQICVIIFSPIVLFAQSDVIGRVVDSEANPLEFIKVSFFSGDSVVMFGVSDAAGSFSIEDVSKGAYHLELSYFGSILYLTEIDVDSDLDLGSIQVEAAIVLEEISITEQVRPRINKALGKFVIEDPSMSSFAKNKSAIDYLRYIPFLNVDNRGGVSILNKGTATIYIDGRKIESADMAFSLLSALPTEQIQAIEIIRNADSRFDAVHSNGIINIVTKRKENEGFRGAVYTTLSQSYYTSEDLGSYLSYSKGKINATGGLSLYNHRRYDQSNNVYNNLITQTQTQIETRSNATFRGVRAYLNMDYGIDGNQKIGFQLNSALKDVRNEHEATNSFRSIYSVQLD